MSIAKRFKCECTLLEKLPNEIFIEIFNYLNGVDTVYAFSQLNVRFQRILLQYVTIFNFQSLDPLKFHYAIEQHDIHQWKSLCLSNDNQTPGQIQLFYQLYPTFESINQLQSLSLLNMEPRFTNEIILQVRSLNQLVSLTIGTICGENIPSFELPLLKQLVVTGCKHTQWMMNFRCLENLEFTISYECHCTTSLVLSSKLKQLKLFYDDYQEKDSLPNVIRPISQLTKLALYQDNHNCFSMPDGRVWEELIKSSLPLLKTFQFCFYFRGFLNEEQKVSSSFSSPFYVHEKRWYSRCVLQAYVGYRYGIIHTLPYPFTKMKITQSCRGDIQTIDSSVDVENNYDIYEKVEKLTVTSSIEMPCQGPRIPNIVHLILAITSIPTWCFQYDNLRYLVLANHTKAQPNDFANLLIRAPHLESLTLSISSLLQVTDQFKNNLVCDLLSQQIQYLIITYCYYGKIYNHVLSVHILSDLTRVFGKTCQYISFAFRANPTVIFKILRHMQRLRSLYIRFRPSFHNINFDLTNFLEEQRRTTNISNFVRTSRDNDFYIWFENRS